MQQLTIKRSELLDAQRQAELVISSMLRTPDGKHYCCLGIALRDLSGIAPKNFGTTGAPDALRDREHVPDWMLDATRLSVVRKLMCLNDDFEISREDREPQMIALFAAAENGEGGIAVTFKGAYDD